MQREKSTRDKESYFQSTQDIYQRLLHNDLELNTSIINAALNNLVSDEFDSLYHNALQGKMDLALSSRLWKIWKSPGKRQSHYGPKFLLKWSLLLKWNGGSLSASWLYNRKYLKELIAQWKAQIMDHHQVRLSTTEIPII